MAETTERLLLQVDAATELLRRHLAEGEQPLDRFERRAEKMAENVDRKISGMGSKFGAFADLADDAAKRAQRSFEASFSQVQRIASQAIKGPTVDGRANLGAEDIRAGAVAAQEQARSFQLIEQAAERAAHATRDESEATRLFIQATRASRIEAEQKAAALAAEAGALERVQIELMQSAEATEHFVTRHQRIAEAAAEQERLAASAMIAARAERELAAQADLLRASIDPMYLAQQRFDQEMTRAETLLRAGAISQREYATATDQARNALNAQAVQLSGSAAAASRMLAAEQALTAEVHQLRGALDPMYAAQQRFDQELDRAERLLRAGGITAREYASAIQLARNNLYEHARGLPVASAATQHLTEEQRRAMAAMMGNRMAMQGLSYQAQDTFTQLSMGANIFQVVAIQGAQAAGQVSHLGGRLGAFGRFMMSLPGLGLTAALLVIGALTKEMHLFSDETDEAVRKLEKDAHQSELTSRAKERFSHTLAGVTEAIRAQTKALDDAEEAERSSAERANIAAREHSEEMLAIRRKTAARLADAVAARDGFSITAGGTSTVSLTQSAEAANVIRLQDELKKAETEVANAQIALNRTRVDLAAEQAAIAVDPVRKVTKLYDDRIKALKDQQREEAKLGRQIGAESKQRLVELEKQKKAAVEAAQARENAARRSNTANRQFGRDVAVAGATAIIQGIGGRVTSGLRTTEQQAKIFADAQAGRHKGPVARPGHSAHERGNAIDVAYGPGISVASIRKAFAEAGVSLRKILNEPTQRVFHVEFGKAGPSAETLDKREKAAERKVLRDDTAYNEEVLRARRKLLDASSKSAIGEEQRAQLLRDEINAEADTAKIRLGNRLAAGEINVAEALRLDAIHEATRQQLLQNVDADRARDVIDRRYDAQEHSLSAELARLRLQEDLAVTDADRRRISQQMLEIEQTLRRQALERVRDTSNDPAAIQRAKDQLGELPSIEKAEQQQQDRRSATPMEAYRDRLRAATSDMRASLEEVSVRGFGQMEDAGSRAASNAVTNLLRIKGVAGDVVGSIIQDLARLAIQKAIVAAVGGGFLGFADGGSLGGVPGFADGGSPGGQIRGPGTGRSDSILALLRGPGGGAVRLSNREFIINERAVDFYGAETFAALNSRRLPKFADGGSLGGPRLPTLRAPRLPNYTGAGGRSDRVQVDVNAKVEAGPMLQVEMQNTAVRTVGAAAEPIMAGAHNRTMRQLRRADLPGGVTG